MALTAEQLAARKVGGSDVATILGLNPYKTELELYFEKIGEIEPPDLSQNRHVRMGNRLEPVLADETAERLSELWHREVKLRRCNLTLVHRTNDWLTAHIDRDVVGLERGVEIKNVGQRASRWWGAEGASDGVPEYYKPQVHAYMLIKDYPVWTVSAYMGGDDLRLYEVERSKEWDELIVEATHDFWHNHVLKGIPPEAASVPERRRLQVAQRVYPGTTGEILEAADLGQVPHITATGELALLTMEQLRHQYEVACAARDAGLALADSLKGSMLLAMGNAAIMQFDSGHQLTRKVVQRKGYTVAATEYLDTRIKQPKKGGFDGAE
jgi:putative phage-type endonuclease